MNDLELNQFIDSLSNVRLAQIEADKEIALAALQVQPHVMGPDWTAVVVVALVIFLPILIVFCYMGYKKYLQHQRRQLNDELIIRLAREGQTLSPEVIAAIRTEEEKKPEAKGSQPSSDAYQKLCTGGALLIGGAVVCLRNRVFGLIMLIVGLFVVAQGLALWLGQRDNTSSPKGRSGEVQ